MLAITASSSASLRACALSTSSTLNALQLLGRQRRGHGLHHTALLVQDLIALADVLRRHTLAVQHGDALVIDITIEQHLVRLHDERSHKGQGQTQVGRLQERSDPVLCAVSLDRRQVLLELLVASEEFQHLVQRNDAHHRDTEVALDFLDRRQVTVATLLARLKHQGRSRW